MTTRPCAIDAPFHLDPRKSAASCRLCFHAVNSPEFRNLWGETLPTERRPCADRHHNPFHHAGGCRTCRLALHSKEHRTRWGEPPLSYWTPEGQRPKPPALKNAPCRFGLEVLTGYERQRAGLDNRQWKRCRHPLQPLKTNIVCPCTGCNSRCAGYSTEDEGERAESKTRLLTFDQWNLNEGAGGHRFNSSLIEWGDGYALAWRHGWKGCEVFVTLLDSQLRQASEPVQLNLKHKAAVYGREDPRWFYFRGQLHLGFTGVMGGSTYTHTNQLYARLGPNFHVEEIFYPRIPNRNPWEKNHVYFEHAGELYAIYAASPHRILRIRGNEAEWAYSTSSPLPWSVDGEIRGGCSPQLVEGEWWHFFHSRRETERGRQYCIGLYSFEAEPPFRITAMVPDAIQWADHESNPGNYCAALFPCGAVRRGDDWLISCGIHDRWTEIHQFNHHELWAKLLEVKP